MGEDRRNQSQEETVSDGKEYAEGKFRSDKSQESPKKSRCRQEAFIIFHRRRDPILISETGALIIELSRLSEISCDP